jgi:hypothetical protein
LVVNGTVAYTPQQLNTSLGANGTILTHMATAYEDPGTGYYRLTTAAVANVSVQSLTGANTVTITVNDGATPIEGAKVRFTKGAASGVQLTNASGVTVFSIDPGTWTVAVTSEPGYVGTTATLVVAASPTTASHTYSLTAQNITPASDPSQTNGYLLADVAGINFQFRLIKITADGLSYPVDLDDETSGSDKMLYVTLLQGAKYRGRRSALDRDTNDPKAPWIEFTTRTASTYELPSILGE